MPKQWPEHQVEQLKALVATKVHTYAEIAALMGLTRNQVYLRAVRLGLKNPAYMLRKTKHSHLHRQLLEYYLTHSAKECQARFGLTPSEFKSCLTCAYRALELAHIRKDKRRHDRWSAAESISLLRRSGVQPRVMIARHLNRGGVHSVKEQLSRLNTGGKFLNGMPSKWVEAAFPLYCDRLPFVKTQAGPSGRRVKHAKAGFEYVIVPWVALRPLLRCRIDPLLKRYIRIMSTFQRWLFPDWTDADIIEFIHVIAKERPDARKTRAQKPSRALVAEDTLGRPARQARKPNGQSDRREGDRRDGKRGRGVR